MSTKKINKEALAKLISESTREHEAHIRSQKTKRKAQRITKQVRLEESLHRKIKNEATERSITMSKYLDKVVVFAMKQGYPY